MQGSGSERPKAHRPAPLAAFLVAAAALAGAANAQDLGIKAPPQNHPVLIENATIHTVSGETIEAGYVLFDGGIIKDVGSGPAPEPVADAVVIDGTGKHVYPGLIGPVTQLGLTEIQALRQSADHDETGDVSPEVFAAVAINPDSTLLPVTRSNGVLIVGTFPTGGTIPGRASVVHLDGWTWEEMAIKPDAGLVISWPQMRPFNAWWMDRSEEEQQRGISERLKAIDEAFDTAAAYLAAKAADPDHPTDLRWEGMRGVFPGGEGEQKPVFIQAQDIDQITGAVSWAVERGLRPVIVGGRDAALCADLLKRHGVPVIVGGTHKFPRRADAAYDEAFTLPAELEAAGVKWCLATSDDTAHERNLPYNAATAAAYGLDPEAAVRGITLSTAEILGIDGNYGSVQTGKSATLIVTSGNPLEITTSVERAFIDGREIDLSNKQTKLAEKYREKYRQREASEGAVAGKRNGEQRMESGERETE